MTCDVMSAQKPKMATTNNNKSTKNVKGDRKMVVAEYWPPVSYYKLPDELDLEDKTVIKDYIVKWTTLYIHFVDGRTLEIEPNYDPGEDIDWKYPEIVKIEDADYNIEYSDDEE
jgi:hypothetical protein